MDRGHEEGIEEAFEPRPEDFRDLVDDRVVWPWALGINRGRGNNPAARFPASGVAGGGTGREGSWRMQIAFTEREEGPRSRRAVGVGDVAGERRGSASVR